MKLFSRFLFSWYLLVCSAFVALSSSAAPIPEWSKLGGAHLTVAKEMVTIPVRSDARETKMKHVKFHVSGGEVKLIKAKVYMVDNQVLMLDIQKRVKPGLETRSFKIADHYRGIKKVVLYYSSPSSHSSDVILLGEPRTE